MRTLIVDDEPLARSRLKRLASKIAYVDVVGEAENGMEAVNMVHVVSPNLILMDVQMPVLSGIEAADEIMQIYKDDPPAIVFCTAHDQHAIDAFRVNASDYLLKPVSLFDLEQSIERACKVSQLGKRDWLDDSTFFTIRHGDYAERVDFGEIDYFRTEGKHVVVGMPGKGEVFVDMTLRELELKYFPKVLRVHRNTVVNRDKIKRLIRNENGNFIELIGCDKVFGVSRRMLGEVKKCFL